MSGQLEDPDDPHDPEELSNPPHLHQVPAHVLPHQGDADVVAERKNLKIRYELVSSDLRQDGEEVYYVHRVLNKFNLGGTSRG